MASVAFQQTPVGNTAFGTRIMVAGVLFQLAAIIVFFTLFCWVIVRGLRSAGEILKQKKVRLIIFATCLSVTVLVIRAVYRTVELLEGWTGHLMVTQKYFWALDGAMMVICVVVFNFARPGWAEPWKERKGVNSGEASEIEVVERSHF